MSSPASSLRITRADIIGNDHFTPVFYELKTSAERDRLYGKTAPPCCVWNSEFKTHLGDIIRKNFPDTSTLKPELTEADNESFSVYRKRYVRVRNNMLVGMRYNSAVSYWFELFSEAEKRGSKPVLPASIKSTKQDHDNFNEFCAALSSFKTEDFEEIVRLAYVLGVELRSQLNDTCYF